MQTNLISYDRFMIQSERLQKRKTYSKKVSSTKNEDKEYKLCSS